MSLFACRRAVALAALIASVNTAVAAEPKVPVGQDPGGAAVAMIGGGIDYTSARIAPRLARDGEGELVGWDLVDDDRAPYAAAAVVAGGASPGDANVAAELLLGAFAHGRLVPVRAPAGDPQALARAIAFVAGTPARIVAITQPLDTAELRLVVRQASARFGDHVFIVSGEGGARGASQGMAGMSSMGGMAGMGGAALPSLMNLGNVVVVTSLSDALARSNAEVAAAADMLILPRGASMFGANPQASPRNGTEAVALSAAAIACLSHNRPAPLAGSAAKAALIDVSQPWPEAPAIRALDPMCWYGGVRFN